VRSQRPISQLGPTGAWFLGVLWGVVGTFETLLVPLVGVLVYGVLAAALILRARARAAIGGGMLLTTGVWFAYLDQSMKARCEAMNSANGSCTVLDPIGSMLPALTFVLVGAALSVYGFGVLGVFGKRSLRGGE
jgi:hypothetical protein